MDPNILRDQLSKLHEELGGVRHVDPRSKQLLADVLEDIQRLLQQDHAGAPQGNASLPERLEKVAVQFELDHPTLAASSRRLIDLLGKAGL
ncbi:MAG TPA: DUF4404 family protein [Steroidobacteraceae bacterium]|nr:DUF4404 family protein [Steroidobacteraceae bacterium]